MSVMITSCIRGLTKVSDQHFRTWLDAKVSYPDGAHRTLADLEERSFWFNHRNAILLAALNEFPPDGPVFDVGGGNGYVSVALRSAGYEAIVIEPGAQARETVLARGLTLIEGSFENLDVVPGSMSAIGAFDVVEHIEDDTSAMRAFFAALKPGGALYLTVPALPWLWSYEDVTAGHFRRHTLNSLRRLLTASGFVPRYLSYFFAGLTPPLLLGRTLPSALGLRQARKLEANEGEHVVGGVLAKLVEAVLDPEVELVRRRKTLPIGTSCLAVAQKPL
jgi:SAM-dependent methyltransferase